MPILKAVTLSLGSLKQPIITRYQLGQVIFNLYINGEYQKQNLCTRKGNPIASDYSRILKDLLDSGVLLETRGFVSRNVFDILGKEAGSPGEIASIVDPFAYVSHLSAMEYHGLTDRFPKILYLSSLSTKYWTTAAKNKLHKDFGNNLEEYINSGFPKLQRTKIQKINRTNVQIINIKSYLGAYSSMRDSAIRVSTIGRTFFDMIKNPEYCGGIRHVIDVYKNQASKYLKAIIEEIDRHGGAIDKVRAGYILEEECKLNDPKIDDWLKYVQRGGSRKLVANAPYSPIFSERWCLSLNLEEA